VSPIRAAEARAADRGMRDIEWQIDLDFHPAQTAIFESPARFKVVAAGRRFGKTFLGGALVLLAALSKPDAVVWWLSPSHSQSRDVMRYVSKLIPHSHRDINRSTGEIFFPNGSVIAFKSGDRFDNLRGAGLDFVVIDEAAQLSEELWKSVVRPMLADKLGRALLISTFNGENWFYDVHRFAIDPANTEWECWTFITATNPLIDPAEIEEARRGMPKEVFEQEFMCSPLAFSGAVFSSERLTAAYAAQQGLGALAHGRPHEAGLDWGWNTTALEVCAELADGRIAWVGEAVWHRVELNERCHFISEVCREHNVVTLYADAAGATEIATLAKALDAAKAPTVIVPVPFNAYKRPGIMTRNFFLEQGREVLTASCPQLYADSKAYHYDKTGEMPEKVNDHTVDAATAFYASRAWQLGEHLQDPKEF